MWAGKVNDNNDNRATEVISSMQNEHINPINPLTSEQRAQFEEQGFLLVSGLIPPEIVSKARVDLDDAAREKSGASFFQTPAANACYTEALCAAAAQLGGGTRPYFPVTGALAIITYPSPGSPGEWTMPSPHIDHALRADGHRVFPPPYRLASLLYLSDVAAHGGGTVVWPRSHRKIEQMAQSAPERFKTMAELNENLASADVGEPQELTPRSGDILFYHYLLAHAGSKNTTEQPRMALNHKW
jgi:hypothetical protein